MDIDLLIGRISRVKRRYLIAIVIGSIIVFNVLIVILVRVESISSQSNLNNYANAYWFSLVTLTTVGYGDIFPMTTYGRLISTIFIFLSLLFSSIFIGIISSIIQSFINEKKYGYKGTNFENHVVIIGWNDLGRTVAEQLMKAGKKLAIVTEDKSHFDFLLDAYSRDMVFAFLAQSKILEHLEKVNIKYSSSVFLNIPDDTEKLILAINIKEKYKDLEYVVMLKNSELKASFNSIGIHKVLSNDELSSRHVASYIYEPDVASYLDEVISIAPFDENNYDIKEFLVTSDNAFINRFYHEVFDEFKNYYNTILVGIVKIDREGKRRLIYNPFGKIHIRGGDYLLILGNEPCFNKLQDKLNVIEGVHN